MPLLKKRNVKNAGHVGHANIKIDGEGTQELSGNDAGGQLSHNEFASTVKQSHTRDVRNQKIFIMGVILVALYAFALVVPKDIVPTILNRADNGYTLSWFILSLQNNLNGLLAVFTGQEVSTIPYENTMIRYIMICFTGAGMALSGAVYQGSFRNALVSPSTLGVMSGASLGLIVYVMFFYDSLSTEFVSSLGVGSSSTEASGLTSFSPDAIFSYLMSTSGLAICSFVGCLFVAAIVLLVIHFSHGGTNAIFMIITGQVLGGIIGAVCNTVRYYYLTVDTYGEKATLLTDLMISSFYRNYTWLDLLCVGVPLIVTFLVVMHLRQNMMLLSLDSAEQRTMGVETKRLMYTVLILCTLLTAIIISFCGQIGFVGFMVPHLARRLVGPNFKYLLPASTVLGAIFVLAAYTLLMITLGASYETMVGMFISIGGAAVFLVTALKGGGAVRGQFR